MKKNIITLTTVIILTAPVLALANKCETRKGCQQRLERNYQNLNSYVKSKGKRGYSEKQIKKKVRKACITKKPGQGKGSR